MTILRFGIGGGRLRVVRLVVWVGLIGLTGGCQSWKGLDGKGPARSTAAPVGGALFIHGGKTLTSGMVREFRTLAGGGEARLVVIPTAAMPFEAPMREALLAEWKGRGFDNVTVLHTRFRDEADSAVFVEPLLEATAVWMSGGQQYRLAESYGGTAVERELHALLERGGVIGGSSAGAAIMSADMIQGGTGTPQMGVGLGLIEGVIIDQHFTERQRQGRLWKAVDAHRGQLGLGIDEGTAVVVRGRLMSVMGAGAARVLLGKSGNRERRVIRLTEGDRHDLVALRRGAIARRGEVYPPAMMDESRVKKGTLVIVGGGVVEGILDRFIEEAGGVEEARIVVVPAAQGEPNSSSGQADRLMRDAGVKDVRIVHATLPADPDTEANLEALRRATGIWFTGGRQWRIVDVFEGTACLEAMRGVLERDGVIGGSSAGASIQGDYLVRGSPLGNQIMMAEGYERGFAFLPGVAIDQHFTQRDRLADLQGVKARFDQILCIGIDEATAIVVEGSTMEVIGKYGVSVYDRALEVNDGDAEFTLLRVGDRYDLATGHVKRVDLIGVD